MSWRRSAKTVIGSMPRLLEASTSSAARRASTKRLLSSTVLTGTSTSIYLSSTPYRAHRFDVRQYYVAREKLTITFTGLRGRQVSPGRFSPMHLQGRAEESSVLACHDGDVFLREDTGVPGEGNRETHGTQPKAQE